MLINSPKISAALCFLFIVNLLLMFSKQFISKVRYLRISSVINKDNEVCEDMIVRDKDSQNHFIYLFESVERDVYSKTQLVL